MIYGFVYKQVIFPYLHLDTFACITYSCVVVHSSGLRVVENIWGALRDRYMATQMTGRIELSASEEPYGYTETAGHSNVRALGQRN